VIAFRIIQEAIQNSVKHAEAKSITVKIVLHESEVEIMVQDDGKGFSLDHHLQSGIGIMNMTRRTKLLNGKIDWSTAAKNGTRVSIHLPAKII
jgi:two-component system sensor histidine kinase DegS